MRIAIIGRSETLYHTARALVDSGYEICCIITSKEAPEYTKTAEDFYGLALSLSVPYIRTLRLEENIETIKQTGADIGVSINYPTIISQQVIDTFSLSLIHI